MKIFVIHYAKLVDRKQHIISQFAKHNFTDYEFVEIDRDELVNENTDIFESGYNKAQIAISLSHFKAYREISEKLENGLILEDDVFLCDSFSDILSMYMSHLPTNYDMMFIGDGCNLHIPKEELIHNKFVYEKFVGHASWGEGGGFGATRCADSYVVSNKGAKKLCEYIDNLTYKINLPVDWWLNIALRDANCSVYWCEPTIATQGTQNGAFSSSH
jgi:glycosyl transferase family 25